MTEIGSPPLLHLPRQTMFDDEFENIIDNSPIYARQITQIKRLAPDLPMERIYSFSSVEAAIFIGAMRKDIAIKRGQGLWTDEYRAKRRKALEEKKHQGTSLSASVTILVRYDQTAPEQKSKTKAKT